MLNKLLTAIIPLLTPSPEQVAAKIQVRAQKLGSKVSPARAKRIATALWTNTKRWGIWLPFQMAVIESESGYKPLAESSVGCIGLMQLAPDTARGLAHDLHIKNYNLVNIEDSVTLGVWYLVKLHDMFDSWSGALTAYNIGPARFRKRKKSNKYSKEVMRKTFEITSEFMVNNETRN